MISVYTGKTGSGKTMLMAITAWKHWMNGKDIYSNTALFFDKYPYTVIGKIWAYFSKNEYIRGQIMYFEDLNEICYVKDGVILFDEGQVIFDAQYWDQILPEFKYKIQQSRKHELDLITTTQHIAQIDVTYRRNLHEWIHCRNWFQLGSSPKIWFGFFTRDEKDMDYFYKGLEEELIPTKKRKFIIIHWFSRVLYDTMFDLGFKKLKIICISDPKTKKQKSYIIEKRKSLSDALRLKSTIQRAFAQKTK